MPTTPTCTMICPEYCGGFVIRSDWLIIALSLWILPVDGPNAISSKTAAPLEGVAIDLIAGT